MRALPCLALCLLAGCGVGFPDDPDGGRPPHDTGRGPEDDAGASFADAMDALEAGPSADASEDAGAADLGLGLEDAGFGADAEGADLGAGLMDAGSPGDGGHISDAGVAMDAGSLADAGRTDAALPRDAGLRDTGVGPADSGVGPADSGVGPADSGVGPTDTGPGVDAGDPLTLLSDEFNGPTLDPSWTALNPSAFTQSMTGTGLLMTPTALRWLDAVSGPGLVKLVSGNFKATVRVNARSATTPSNPPDHDFQLAGVLARDPASDLSGRTENYVFTVLGFSTPNLCVETKSTVNDVSNYACPTWGSGDAELRICRLGGTFRLYKRAIGATSWTLSTTYNRALPNTLQVGPIAYGVLNYDLIANFDFIHFAGVSNVAGCTTDP